MEKGRRYELEDEIIEMLAGIKFRLKDLETQMEQMYVKMTALDFACTLKGLPPDNFQSRESESDTR